MQKVLLISRFQIPTISVFTDFPCKFKSPQVKQSFISSIINFVQKLPQEFT